MNPIDKAKELFNLYFPLVEAYSSESQIDNAKQSAIISIDQILNALEYNNWQNRFVIEWYNEVKKEINKL